MFFLNILIDMSKHPLNLVLRFLLEVTALVSIGYWGWHQFSGTLSFVVAFLFPVLAAVVWGVFAVRNDPTRSGKTVINTPGYLRLVLELAVFGFGSWGLYDSGVKDFSVILLLLVVVHYAISYDRVFWLLKQK